MVTLKNRDETILHGDTIRLQAKFKDGFGVLTDLDSFPTITLVQPSGNVLLGPTTLGVVHLDTGLYGFDYEVGINANIGVWMDIWDGELTGIPVSGTGNFIVYDTQLPSVNTDGYESLGDDPGFNYSQNAIHNINLLLKSLKARLDSSGKAFFKDENGNDNYVDCDIYSPEQLICFLADSLSMFNEVPHFTFFTFEDTQIIAQFHDIIVQGAVIWALASKALLERGREFSITDAGLSFSPPGVSDIMMTEYNAELQLHKERLDLIKKNMKPFPKASTVLSISSARSPAFSRLRHRRQNQIF